MASTTIPDDMEFINRKIQAIRPDGKPHVPIWVTTEENMVCLYFIFLCDQHSFRPP